MTEHEQATRDDRALRERVGALSAAVLRVSASLDLDTVLREVVEAARALTGARIGVATTFDEAGGRFGGFCISGATADEERELAAWPDRERLFAHLLEQPGPLRLADLGDHVLSLGLDPTPALSRTFQGTPMRHRGTDVGHFFVADKAGGNAFTDGDEEVLVLFAAQAAAAIANARAHGAERRARTHLEALVETSPVGVAVLDAQSGQVESLNREARAHHGTARRGRPRTGGAARGGLLSPCGRP